MVTRRVGSVQLSVLLVLAVWSCVCRVSWTSTTQVSISEAVSSEAAAESGAQTAEVTTQQTSTDSGSTDSGSTKASIQSLNEISSSDESPLTTILSSKTGYSNTASQLVTGDLESSTASSIGLEDPASSTFPNSPSAAQTTDGVTIFKQVDLETTPTLTDAIVETSGIMTAASTASGEHFQEVSTSVAQTSIISETTDVEKISTLPTPVSSTIISDTPPTEENQLVDPIGQTFSTQENGESSPGSDPTSPPPTIFSSSTSYISSLESTINVEPSTTDQIHTARTPTAPTTAMLETPGSSSDLPTTEDVITDQPAKDPTSTEYPVFRFRGKSLLTIVLAVAIVLLILAIVLVSVGLCAIRRQRKSPNLDEPVLNGLNSPLLSGKDLTEPFSDIPFIDQEMMVT